MIWIDCVSSIEHRHWTKSASLFAKNKRHISSYFRWPINQFINQEKQTSKHIHRKRHYIFFVTRWCYSQLATQQRPDPQTQTGSEMIITHEQLTIHIHTSTYLIHKIRSCWLNSLEASIQTGYQLFCCEHYKTVSAHFLVLIFEESDM